METYALAYVEQVASGSSMYEARKPAVFCDNLEGWGGEGGS